MATLEEALKLDSMSQFSGPKKSKSVAPFSFAATKAVPPALVLRLGGLPLASPAPAASAMWATLLASVP